MDIGLQSQMFFGDEESLRDFFLVHRFSHEQYAAAIAARGGGATPLGGISGGLALDAWVAAMHRQGSGHDAVLVDWLELHQQLHQAEYTSLGFGLLPDLRDVDFSKESEFYDWMYGHTQIHQAIGQFLGVQ